MGTGQQRGQESPHEEGSEEVIWLVPSVVKGLWLLTQEMTAIEFTRFFSCQLRGVRLWLFWFKDHPRLLRTAPLVQSNIRGLE